MTRVQRIGLALTGVIAVALVFMSIQLTDRLGLAPCPLCIFQRVLYLLLGGFALFAAAAPLGRRLFAALAALAALGGLATAAYQSWMQAFPARFLTCGVGEPANVIEELVAWLGRLVPSMFRAWGECTSREWELLHLSFANWSALAFLGFLIGLLLLARRSQR